jgi:hypothetical protein
MPRHDRHTVRETRAARRRMRRRLAQISQRPANKRAKRKTNDDD